jgi:parallel beta-helix repeat protein
MLTALEDRRLLALFFVTNTGDSGDGSLRWAIDQANSKGGANTIDFSSLFNTPQTITLTSGQLWLKNGTETITGPAAGLTVSAGNKNRVIEVAANVTANISALTITEGGGSSDRGGGLLNLGTLSLANCTISGNAASPSDAFRGSGGGLYNRGAATLTNCTVSGNKASGYGGGIANYGTVSLANCTVTGNKAGGYGGGLENHGPATLTNCTFASNAAGTSYYGGDLDSDNTVDLFNCTFVNNTAGRYGGGLYNNGAVGLTNCTFSSNAAGSGYYGGGLYNNNVATLVSCTFNGNAGKYGGGFYNNNRMSLTNTIVAGNTAASAGPDVYGSVTSLGHNLIGNTQGSSGWGSSDLTNTNPRLAPLGFYGGPTQTMALLTGSPAIHAGIVPGGVTADQRGFALDNPADIGAFQVQSGPLAWQVNSTADPGVPYGTLGLRGAVALADLLPGAHTITFDPNVFATAQAITLTTGQLELSNTTGAQTIIGPAGGLTVSGGGLSRVFQVDAGVTASSSRLTVTRGGGSADRGGGLLNLGTANLTLTNCTISGNTASTNGGGLANYGTVNLNNCVISGNTAFESGGALFSSINPGGGTATLATCTVTGNTAGARYGGGLSLKGPASLTGCTISNNTAGLSGGGFWLYAASSGATTLTNCTVSGNRAATAGGGVESVSGAVTLANCTITANSAAQSGGGLMNDALGVTTLTDCTVTGNTADGGGGFYNNGTISLTSCTVSANSGGAKGGGGLFNTSSHATLTNSIVAGNINGSTPPGPSDIAGGINVSGTFNLIGAGGAGGLTNGAAGNIVGVTSPGLAKLAYYGGPTQTMALLPGSAAIGAGTAVSGLTTDQRGFPLHSSVDIGAFQVQSSALVVNTIFDGASVPSGKLDLRGAVNLADVLPGAHEITFDPSVFDPTHPIQAIALTSGQLELSNTGGTQTITGPAAGVMLNGGGLSRVFQVDGGVTAFISGLSITGGRADRGGGLLNSGNVTLTACTITGNTASRNGGGLANYATVTLTDCTVSSNNSTNGGGLANYGTATLNDSIVRNNSSRNGGGLLNNGTMNVTNCTVSGDSATSIGGGIANYGTATVTKCTVSNNSANYGAGLFNVGTATLTNCTVSGNSARSSGGGLQIRDGKAYLTNCTVSANATRGQGGGLLNNGTVTLTDTIVAGNLITSSPPVASDIAGVKNVSGTFNLIGTGGSGGLTNGAGGNLVGVAGTGLSALGFYGGATQTMALLPGSPAIGKGTPAGGVTTDQRGLARGTLVDIGAFQTSLVVESTAGAVNTDPAQLTLAGAVSLADGFAGPIAISFDPAVFTAGQSITLTGDQLELDNTGTIPTWTITGPEAGVVVSGGGLSRVFQVDAGVRASISNLSIREGSADLGGALLNLAGANLTLTECSVIVNTASKSGGGLANYGVATLTDCGFNNDGPGASVFSAGGKLTVSNSIIAGPTIAIALVTGAAATITGGEIITFDKGTGIVVGSGPNDACTVAVHNVDLSSNTTGIKNNGSRPVDATFDWWGSADGPGGTGASNVVGLVNFSPWLGDARSLELSTPDSLGFASTASSSYVVTPITTGPSSPNLSITLSGDLDRVASVTATGAILFAGSGGSVTINGESGTGFQTNAFTITNGAVTCGAGDAFKGATIQLNGNISRRVVAGGTANTFDVSGWMGAGALAAAKGTVSTLVASKNAGYTLTNTSLTSTDGMNLVLSGITAANLTTTATSTKPTVVDASSFTGVTNLSAGGTGPAIVHGGKGGGSLTATGSGNDVLIGGPGANTLTDNGTGFNILIGGGGPNTIYGNGKDILISGRTIYDPNTSANIAALDAILSEWSSNDAYGIRIAKISKGISIGSHNYALHRTTVRSNGKSSTVSDGPTQSQNQNWFIVNSTDSYTQRDETVTIINTLSRGVVTAASRERLTTGGLKAVAALVERTGMTMAPMQNPSRASARLRDLALHLPHGLQQLAPVWQHDLATYNPASPGSRRALKRQLLADLKHDVAAGVAAGEFRLTGPGAAAYLRSAEVAQASLDSVTIVNGTGLGITVSAVQNGTGRTLPARTLSNGAS